MLPLMFYYILEGAVVAFYIGFLYKIVAGSIVIAPDTNVNLKTAYVFLVLGFGEFCGGILTGFLAE